MSIAFDLVIEFDILDYRGNHVPGRPPLAPGGPGLRAQGPGGEGSELINHQQWTVRGELVGGVGGHMIVLEQKLSVIEVKYLPKITC